MTFHILFVCTGNVCRSPAAERLLRRELERMQIERTETLPPKRPLNELDRALPSLDQLRIDRDREPSFRGTHTPMVPAV